jgi:hypothetical protein
MLMSIQYSTRVEKYDSYRLIYLLGIKGIASQDFGILL